MNLCKISNLEILRGGQFKDNFNSIYVDKMKISLMNISVKLHEYLVDVSRKIFSWSENTFQESLNISLFLFS